MGSSLRLLGAPKLASATELNDLPLDKPASLLYYLLRRGDWVSRSELAFLYRPDAPDKVALSNVRLYLHRAKERPWAAGLEAEKLRVRFRADTDIAAFERACRQEDWGAALALYRGPFLAGLQLKDVPGYDTWLELERQDLAQKWRRAALQHAQDRAQQQDFAGAESWLERVLLNDPLDEDALQANLRVLFAQGQRSRALELYEQFCRTLREELEVDPLETTQALFASLKQTGARSEDAQQASLAKRSLPAQTTRFVGRQRELGELTSVLAKPDCRLLSLVGLGGVGKTRLALELAAQQRAQFPDGVYFVALAGVSAPDRLASSVAGALLPGVATLDPEKQLGNFLRDKTLLMLLDNFEQLLSGAAWLEELLGGAPGLKLIVTTRAALELRAEWLYDVRGLSYPELGETAPERFDAVKLFVDRAARRSPSFVPEGGTLGAVAALTRQVEGMPLALELAATWLRSLSVPDLTEELRRNFDLLSGRLRDLPERQRSLRSVFDYSWQRLNDQEQRALARLSLFQGGFDLAAAEQVAGVHLALLLGLINHSLLRKTGGRYQLHELLKQYAGGFLGPDDKPGLETRFYRTYLARVAQSGPALRGPDQREVKARLLEDIDNLRSACELATAQQAWDAIDAALGALTDLFIRTGLLEEGRVVLERLVAAAEHPTVDSDVNPAKRLRLRARLCLGRLLSSIGLFQEARDTLQAILGELRRAGLEHDLSQTLNELAHTARRTGASAEADTYLSESLALAERLGAQAQAAEAHYQWALLERDRGQFERARTRLETSLALREGLGDTAATAATSSQLAVLALQQGGDRAAPRNYLQQALESFRQLGDRERESVALYNLGRIGYAEGDFEASEALLQACLQLCQHLGVLNLQEKTYSSLGELRRAQARYDEARAFFEQSLALSRRLHSPEGQVYALADLGDVARRQGDRASARRQFLAALRLAASSDVPASTVLELCYFLALFLSDLAALGAPAGREAFLLTEVIAAHEGVTRHIREQLEALAAQLRTELSDTERRGLAAEAASLSLEAVVTRHLRLLDSL